MPAPVRPANLRDAEAVFALTRDFATSFIPERAPFDISFAHLIGQDDARLVVAEASGELIGYLLGFDHWTLFANGRVSWVEEIMVRDDRRRHHIGSHLLADFEQWAQSRGSKYVALATRRAAGFYLALGYEETAACFRKLL